MKCTAVIGHTYYGVTTSVKTVELAPGGYVSINWNAASDYPGAVDTQSANVACILPKGTSLHEVAWTQEAPAP